MAKSRAPRRRYEDDFKRRIVTEANASDVSVSEIARRHGLNANLLFNWRKKFGGDAPGAALSDLRLLPVEIKPEETPEETVDPAATLPSPSILETRMRNMFSKSKHLTFEYDGMNLELYFATEVLKLNSLHYGLFPEGFKGEFTLAALRQAQTAFTENLLSHLPDDVRTVADIGAGIGDNTRALAARGMAVTAVSPDKNHAQYYNNEQSSGIDFHNVKFEEFRSSQKFDAVLFSESLNYMDHNHALDKCRQMTEPGKTLLIANMFRLKGKKKYADNFNIRDLDFIKLASKYDFELVACQDITERTAPNMESVHELLDSKMSELLKIGHFYLKKNGGMKYKFFHFLFRKQFEKFSKRIEYYKRRSDPETYCQNCRYVVLKFRRVEEADQAN